jgi:predicted RND superfamily exporter protein
MPVRRFGGVTAISLAISMLAGLLVLPALLTLLARWRRKSLVRKRYAEEKELALEPLVQSPPSLP